MPTIHVNGKKVTVADDATILDEPMPLRDAETSAMCQQQCQMLLARMSKSSGFVDKVRQLAEELAARIGRHTQRPAGT